MTEEQIARMRNVTGRARMAKPTLDKIKQYSLQEQRGVLNTIAATAGRGLNEVRQDFARGQERMRFRAVATVRQEAQVVQKRLAQSTSNLVRKARAIQTQAYNHSAQAVTLAAGMNHWAAGIQQVTLQWPTVQADNAIQLAAASEALLPTIRGKAVDVLDNAAFVDKLAVQTLNMLKEADNRTKNASTTALLAVEQATQNSKKLKATRDLLETARASAAEAALAVQQARQAPPGSRPA